MVLRSPQAVQMSVFVVRAFVAMRSMLTEQRDLARKLAELERTLTERPDTHEHAISDIIQQIMQLLSPPPEPEADVPARPRIGFSVQERRTAYKAGKKASGRRPILVLRLVTTHPSALPFNNILSLAPPLSLCHPFSQRLCVVFLPRKG